MTLNRRTLLSAAGAVSLGGLAACDEQTMKTIQSRLNPTQGAGGAGAPAPAATAAPPPANAGSTVSATVRMPAEPWTYARFNAAMAASERPHTISETQFAAIQARKPAAITNIRTYLDSRFGAHDPNVLRAFESLPREYFHYAYAQGASTASQAYEANPKPWAIGHGLGFAS
jgi:protein-L-isoaspartate(D-aspartate) O-methyltransferase